MTRLTILPCVPIMKAPCAPGFPRPGCFSAPSSPRLRSSRSRSTRPSIPSRRNTSSGPSSGPTATAADLVVLTLDTPGGLDTSMREIIDAIVNAKTPVAAFVGPSGAGRLGRLLHRPGLRHLRHGPGHEHRGRPSRRRLSHGASMDKTMEEKVVNDAASYHPDARREARPQRRHRRGRRPQEPLLHREGGAGWRADRPRRRLRGGPHRPPRRPDGHTVRRLGARPWPFSASPSSSCR